VEESKKRKSDPAQVQASRAKNSDRVEVLFPKGVKALIKAAAEAQGETLNEYVRKAVEERMRRETTPSK
jgi:predicted HicB family RNase H-like nuclease